MAPGLCHRIFDHLEELGLLQPGMQVLDFMAGIATSLAVGASRGYPTVGVELEDKFVKLARANMEALGRRIVIPPWEIIQGDARHLSELLQGQGQAAGVVSPPWLDTKQEARKPDDKLLWGNKRYGHQDNRTESYTGYGSSPGQIGSLPDVAIVSPPYEDSKIRYIEEAVGKGWDDRGRAVHDNIAGYGQTNGQIGRQSEQEEKGESYLSAMRQVYAEAFKVCPVLVVVVKDPTRNKVLRPLGQDTIALLQSVGYEIVCVHKAILFEEQQGGHLFEGTHKKVKGRMSFFKRLQWQRGNSELAQWEWVIFALRPGEGPVAVTSPPYFETSKTPPEKDSSTVSIRGRDYAKQRFGSTPGQIGRLR